MPRSKYKVNSQVSWQRRFGEKQADVTLNDFANSTKTSTKLKKAALNLNTITYNVLLDEHKCEAIEEYIEEDTEEEVVKRRRRRLFKNVNSNKTSESFGKCYPKDIWFIISKFVYPEDISTFACICKDSYAVVNSISFWRNLYHRYYKPDVDLPQRLRPECMSRPRNLRACVVRSLFYTYPPFVDRLYKPTISNFVDKANLLVKARCVLMWYQKSKTACNFYFKFRFDGRSKSTSSTMSKSTSKDLMNILGDINANPEDGCQVLQVICNNFIPTPIVIGLTLSNVKVTTSQMNHCYQLKLTFANTNSVELNFEPVSNIRVLNWWHQQYPHRAS